LSRRTFILGSGGMGTAMASLIAQSGRPVTVWGREPALLESIRATGENQRYLPGVPLPETIQWIEDPADVSEDCELILVAIPSAFLRATLRDLAPALPDGVPAVSVVKGLELERFARPTEIILEELGARTIAVLSGPSHAEEIARGLPASVAVAGPDEAFNRAVRDALSTDRFRVYSNADPIGVELAGALKNIIGVAAGVCDGLGFGDNAKAALLTRGLAEMARFGRDQGAQTSTFLGLAGVGDLITTCYSPYGRNRSLGERIGRGETLEAITASTPKIAEGVPTCLCADEMAKRRGFEMPITAELRQILFEGKPPRDALPDLMERAPKDEWP